MPRLFVPALLVAACSLTLRWMEEHAYFRLRSVSIDGARDPEVIVAWAGLSPDASLWSIDPRRTELRLLEHPRIRSASVRREFPGRLHVQVEERRALAVILLDRPLLVDEEGQIFPPLPRELLEDYPYVTGIRADDFDTRPAWVMSRLREAAKALRLWKRHPDWPAVSELRPGADGDVVVHPEQTPMTIRFASRVDEEQFSRLSAVLELWRGRETQVAAIDLTVPGQAVLELRAGGEKTGRTRI